jgi:hypothetical protein
LRGRQAKGRSYDDLEFGHIMKKYALPVLLSFGRVLKTKPDVIPA